MINWLASYPKSGNTWARMLLTAYHHDGHCNINDTPFTGDIASQFYQGATVRCLFDLSVAERALLRPAALINLIACTRYRPLVVKTHCANVELFGQRMIPPILTRSAVYIVRDPRTLAPSYARHFGKSLEEAVAAINDEGLTIGGGEGRVEQMVSSWSNHVRSWGAKDPEATLVRFEDMKADPGDALERMLVTFGVKPDGERIDRAVKASELARLKEQEAERGFSEASRKAGGNFFGGTTEALDDAQRLRVENDHGDMMEQMGY